MEMLHSWPNLKIFLIYPVKWVPLSLCISFSLFLWLCISEGRGCFPGGSDGKESAHSAGDPGSIPGLGRSPGGGHGNPLQYSCLENPMDKGAWWAPWGHRVRHDWMTNTHFWGDSPKEGHPFENEFPYWLCCGLSAEECFNPMWNIKIITRIYLLPWEGDICIKSSCQISKGPAGKRKCPWEPCNGFHE